MDATAFVHMALQHMQSQCKELYSLDDIGSTTWRPNCGASSQHPLPELNLKRVVLELSSKSELGSTPSSDVFHVLIDGSKHAAFKQQTVQRHLTGYFFPHLAGSVRPSSEEEVRHTCIGVPHVGSRLYAYHWCSL